VVPITAGDPAAGWTDSTTLSEPPGAQLEIVAPTGVGGSTCEVFASCACNSSAKWVAQPNANPYCPN
jgi:hypothetical protein